MGGNKSLPREMAKHFQREFLAVLEKDFTLEGELVPQRVIEKRLHMSQPVISAIKTWNAETDTKQPPIGWAAALALSEYTHKSIDALLGRELPLAVAQRQAQLDAIVAKSEEMTMLLAKESTFSFGPKSKIGKLREEIQKLARNAKQQRAIDDRERMVNEMPTQPRKTG